MKSMETGRQDGGSDKNHAPFSVGKTGNISRKFLTIILKIFDKNFERLQEYLQGTEKDNKEIAEHIEKLQKEYDIEMKEEKQEKEKTEQVEKEEQIFPKKVPEESAPKL